MGMSRYVYSRKIKVGDVELLSSSLTSTKIFQAVNNGLINCQTKILEEGERLDTVASLVYGDAAYWWVIAAASGIGWSLQVTAGTYLQIPTDLNQVFRYVS